MPRTFNTTGPCDEARHYMLPAEARLPDLVPWVEEQLYFVLHAARQTGKTTAMRAFAARLRERGYVAVWVTLEESQGRTEIADAEPSWVSAVYIAAENSLPTGLLSPPARVGRRAPGWPTAPNVLARLVRQGLGTRRAPA